MSAEDTLLPGSSPCLFVCLSMTGSRFGFFHCSWVSCMCSCPGFRSPGPAFGLYSSHDDRKMGDEARVSASGAVCMWLQVGYRLE